MQILHDYHPEPESIKIAEIGGQLIEYDACVDEPYSSAIRYHTPDRWEYLGMGSIYSINGIGYSDDRSGLHFFKLNPTKV